MLYAKIPPIKVENAIPKPCQNPYLNGGKSYFHQEEHIQTQAKNIANVLK